LVAARDAAGTIGGVVSATSSRLIRSVVVIDNGSNDATAQVALDAGAVVLRESRGGYGAACQRGVAHLESLPTPPDAVVFMAADGSDDPEQLAALVEPIQAGNAELVVGARGKGRGSTARVGVRLISALYRYRFEDLCPYRAIRFPALVALGLRDRGSGWHVEMQVKALKLGLQIAEIPVTQSAQGRRAGLGAAAAKAGRTVFQILRHSTAR